MYGRLKKSASQSNSQTTNTHVSYLLRNICPQYCTQLSKAENNIQHSLQPTPSTFYPLLDFSTSIEPTSARQQQYHFKTCQLCFTSSLESKQSSSLKTNAQVTSNNQVNQYHESCQSFLKTCFTHCRSHERRRRRKAKGKRRCHGQTGPTTFGGKGCHGQTGTCQAGSATWATSSGSASWTSGYAASSSGNARAYCASAGAEMDKPTSAQGDDDWWVSSIARQQPSTKVSQTSGGNAANVRAGTV